MGAYDYLSPPQIVTGAAIPLVTERFNLATEYATNLWALAQDLLSQLGSVDISVTWEPVGLEDVGMGGLDGLTLAPPTRPVIDSVAIADPGFSHVAPSPVTDELPVRDAPVYNVNDPGISIPDSPDITWPVFSGGNAPYPSEPAIPEAPVVSLPPVPSLSGVSIPSPPEYSIPEFDWDLPTENLTAPEPSFSYSESMYSSDLKSLLNTKLYDNLSEGGTGLNEATEQAIYDRATFRLATEEQAAYDQIMNLFADHGYMLPPGALAGQILEIENKILRTREDINNDILIQQSKLAQENTHFIIDRSINWEKQLMDFVSQYQMRALDAAKFVVLSAIEVYKGKVAAYTARLEAYKAQAVVYSARIQGEIAKAEFYKAQIQGIMGSVEIQKALVEAYVAQVGAVGVLINLYKAQMEGAKIKAEVDQIRIQSFAATVQAYATQVSAATERYKGYLAQIQGEAVKAEVYGKQIDAYTARVGAYRTEIEADTLVLKQAIAVNENAVEIFKVQLQEYMTKVNAATAQAEILAKNEGLKIDMYKAETASYGAELDAAAKVFLGKVEEAKAAADIEIKEADLILRQAIAKQELVQGNVRAAAQIASQMAAAAIAGVNASANVGFGENRSDSTSNSFQISISSQSIDSHISAVQHNYYHAS
jgi:hypothetical protein